jgi:hypothetical protein
MTRSFPAALVGGLLLLGARDARAFSDSLRADIPFDFAVGGATLPAGQYRVSYDAVATPDVLMIRSQDGRHNALVLAEPVDTGQPTKQARLVFQREGASYRLYEVFDSAARVGLGVLEPHPVE